MLTSQAGKPADYRMIDKVILEEKEPGCTEGSKTRLLKGDVEGQELRGRPERNGSGTQPVGRAEEAETADMKPRGQHLPRLLPSLVLLPCPFISYPNLPSSSTAWGVCLCVLSLCACMSVYLCMYVCVHHWINTPQCISWEGNLEGFCRWAH